MRNCQTTRRYPDYAPKQVLEESKLDNCSVLFRHQEERENQSCCREYTVRRDQEGTRMKGRIQSNVRFGPVLNMKVCSRHRGYSIEIQVQSLFQDQTVSWIGIVNGIDNFVREVMPIKEEEKVSVKPAAKARPILKPSSTSGWDFHLVEQRQWIDIEITGIQGSLFFQVSKFITRSLRHSQMMEQSIRTKLLMNARKSYPTIQNIGQTRGRSTSSMLSIG